MALTKFTVDVKNIQALSDKPNATDGLTSAELKARFDKAATDIKTFINDTLTTEIDNLNIVSLSFLQSNYSTTSTIASDYLSKAGNLTGITNAETARTNLGLGSIATKNITVSTIDPSGGVDGDIWIKYS